jgi:hypothetical protein
MKELFSEILKIAALTGAGICLVSWLGLGLTASAKDLEMRDNGAKEWWNPFRELPSYETLAGKILFRAFLGGVIIAGVSSASYLLLKNT